MKEKSFSKNSIVNTQLFKKYKEELGKEHDFSDLEEELRKRDEKNTNLGRS